ncbi:MAG: hypothetical protein ACTHM9_11415 [Gemmatimonadales bacterium]
MVEIDRGIPLTRDTLTRDPVVPQPGEPRVSVMEAGSLGEAVGGAAALVLAILGLLGLLPMTLAAIAMIALGAGLLAGGAALSRRYVGGMPPAVASRARQEIVGALGMQALAGIAAIVLGVLALLRVSPAVLLGIGVLVLGGALLAAGGATALLARSARWLRSEASRYAESDTWYPATGWWEAEVGVGAVVLGILALTGHSPLALTLVALLCVGAALLIGGTLIAARLFSYFG